MTTLSSINFIDQNIEKCIDFLDKHFYEGKNPYRKPLGKIRIVGENEDK